MRALDPEVQEAVWQAVEPLVPRPVETHPHGCHRRRKSDRDCFQMMLVRLATGCSWEDAEALWQQGLGQEVRERRDAWVAAGLYAAIAGEAIRAYDRVIGLDLSEVAVDQT